MYVLIISSRSHPEPEQTSVTRSTNKQEKQQLRAFVPDHKVEVGVESVCTLIKTPHCGNCNLEEVVIIRSLA